jgi:hypothetical protein
MFQSAAAATNAPAPADPSKNGAAMRASVARAMRMAIMPRARGAATEGTRRGARAQDHHQRERAETADRERVLQVDQQRAIGHARGPPREQAEREPGVAEMQAPQLGLVPDRDRPPTREAERGENAGNQGTRRGDTPHRQQIGHDHDHENGQRRALEIGLHAAAKLLSPPVQRAGGRRRDDPAAHQHQQQSHEIDGEHEAEPLASDSNPIWPPR